MAASAFASITFPKLKRFPINKTIEKKLKRLLPSTGKTNIGFTGKKSSTCFQFKKQAKFEHKHDIVYLGTYPEDNSLDNRWKRALNFPKNN